MLRLASEKAQLAPASEEVPTQKGQGKVKELFPGLKHWPVSNDCTEKLVWNIEKLSKAVPETEGKDRRGEEALGTVIVAVPTVMSQVKGLETVTALPAASLAMS